MRLSQYYLSNMFNTKTNCYDCILKYKCADNSGSLMVPRYPLNKYKLFHQAFQKTDSQEMIGSYYYWVCEIQINFNESTLLSFIKYILEGNIDDSEITIDYFRLITSIMIEEKDVKYAYSKLANGIYHQIVGKKKVGFKSLCKLLDSPDITDVLRLHILSRYYGLLPKKHVEKIKKFYPDCIPKEHLTWNLSIKDDIILLPYNKSVEYNLGDKDNQTKIIANEVGNSVEIYAYNTSEKYTSSIEYDYVIIMLMIHNFMRGIHYSEARTIRVKKVKKSTPKKIIINPENIPFTIFNLAIHIKNGDI